MKKIYSELNRIQKELKAPKNLYNNFGKYSYRNAEGILEAVKPLLNDTVLLINDEIVLIGDRFYIKATATLTDGEESISTTAYAREDKEKKGMDGSQITGACSSYARKYALNALLMIDDNKDSDDDSLSPKNPKNKDTEDKDEQRKPDKVANTETANKVPLPTPAQAFLSKAIKQLSVDIPDMDFPTMRKALVAEGLIEDKASEKVTMEEAQGMITLMYQKWAKSK